jgi:hypothetical protein
VRDSKISFDFGYNVKPKKAPKAKQSKATKQAFALAKKKGGPLHSRSWTGCAGTRPAS